MPRLTIQEVEQRLLAAKPWKAPGADGLPVGVWKQVWPVVKDRVLVLFKRPWIMVVFPPSGDTRESYRLRKPGKEDYTVAKAWRPISLLSTLGKVLEAVVGERVSLSKRMGYSLQAILEQGRSGRPSKP